jgi:hypothetical protein
MFYSTGPWFETVWMSLEDKEYSSELKLKVFVAQWWWEKIL